ncbi:MAG TPA: PQQ-binding-like beta-propeller repeat protein [Nitriliruptorales bacterium]|nr:PQQ-binding-like beta-propeller repeat protein [Nitriliruptorales bacterium]
MVGTGLLLVATRLGQAGVAPAVAGPTPSSVPAVAGPTSGATTAAQQPATSPAVPTTAAATATPHRLVDRSTVGRPWGTVPGLLQFRGNPTHTWYGTGPIPDAPRVLWRYPDRPMCTDEVVGGAAVREPASTSSTQAGGAVKRWCGSGWTGQPVVWERPDGRTEVIFGAYDGAVHFVDAATGRDLRPAYATGDIIKGSVTLDPDGFPLLYAGSRDGALRVLALDRERPEELWALTANRHRVWNDDWDGNPSIVDGILLEGGEDSWFYAVALHRHRDASGLVQVAPQVVASVPGWTDQLLTELGDRNVSFESSVAVFEGRAYLANSGGRVVGYDLEGIDRGELPVVFDFWMGDDVDASVVVDGDGALYVAAELERRLPRALQVGQLVKLDPSRPDDPVVWRLDVPGRVRPSGAPDAGGMWATPALHRGMLYVTTHAGDLLAVGTDDGVVRWRERIGYHEWSSPAVVDDTLIVGACERGGALAWDVTDPDAPSPRWAVQLPTGGCVESTPAVWRGRIYVGSRDGFFYALGSD